MSKRVFIVHGWDGNPEEGWFPWLKKELEAKGFQVFVPQLPEPEVPKINKWVPALAQAVGQADGETYFIGHSMGCQAIIRYLDTLPEGSKVGGAVFVAGFAKRLTNLGIEDGEDEKVNNAIAAPWLETLIDWPKVKTILPKSIAIFSDNDPFVPLDNQDDFKEKLNSQIIVEHQKGHLSGENGIFELPTVLNSLLTLTSL